MSPDRWIDGVTGGELREGGWTEARDRRSALIVVDSSSLLSEAETDRLPIRVVPLGVGDDDPASMRNDSPLGEQPIPTRTSGVAPGAYVRVLEAAAEAGTREVLIVTVASRMSSTMQAASLGASIVQANHPGLRVEIIDSETAVAGLALVTLAAAGAAADGLDQARRAAAEAIERVVTFGVVVDWEAMERSGRIPVAAVRVAKGLGLRPCFRIARGAVRPWRMFRSNGGAILAMARSLHALPGSGRLHAAVYAGDEVRAAADLAAALAEDDGAAVVRLRTTEVVAAHAGRGIIGAAAWREP